jgi:hypothetical protein
MHREISWKHKMIHEDDISRWQSCCFDVDRNAVKFFTQVAFGASIMGFAMTQIMRGVDNQEIYFSMLSGTLGLFLPHPEMKQ